MKKGYRRLLDLALLLAGAAILVFLLLAPPATTPELPVDQLHRPVLSMALQQGKKSAERSCLGCHNAEQAPLPTDHSGGQRCLSCHRLPTPPLRQP